MLSAVISGMIFYKFNGADSICLRINEIFNEYMLFVKNNSKPDVFSGLLLSAFVFYIALTLLSTSIIGKPLIYLAVFFKISGLSTLLFTLYSQIGLKGIEYSLLIMLPGKYLMILSLFILADSSSQLCNIIMDNIQGRSDKIKKHIIILIITAIIMIISVVFDYFTLIAFAGLFNF